MQIRISQNTRPQLLLLAMLFLISCQTQNDISYDRIAVGTYTKKEGHVDGKGEGIYILRMNKQSGALSITDTISGIVNPSYLQVADKQIWAVSEVVNETNLGGSLIRFDLSTNNILNQVDVKGGAPCHLDLSKNRIVVANYMGTISVLEYATDLKLFESISHSGEYHGPPRQESAHPHMIYFLDNDNAFLVADLGMDAIIHYRMENDRAIEVARTKTLAGAGPRHMTRKNDKVFVLCELSNNIEVYEWKGIDSMMQRTQTISAFPNVIPSTVSNAAIHLHPSKPFLYISNRGINNSKENSLSLFHISTDGKLEYKNKYSSGGEIPRDFAISPDGRFLLSANQDSDNILVYSINPIDGTLEKTEHNLKIPTPVCLKFF